MLPLRLYSNTTRMKRFVYMTVCLALAAIAGTGCSEKEGPDPQYNPRPVWETYSHARLMKFSGVVQQVTTVEGTGEESNTLLDARFDGSGRLLSYNPTGIELEPEQMAPVTRWGVAVTWFDYAYDTTGRLTSVTKYEVGADPEVFTITYGTHTSYIPAPFPLGDIEPFMLRGVTRIQSTAGYTMTCNGSTATATQSRTWPPVLSETTLTISRGVPANALTIEYANQGGVKGEERSRTETSYTYERNWLVGMESAKTYSDGDGSDDYRLVTQYSTEWPCTLSVRERYLGQSQTPEFRIEYRYAENGQPLGAAYTIGTYEGEFFEQPFEQRYTNYDEKNNWITAIRTVDATEIPLTRTLTYF